MDKIIAFGVLNREKAAVNVLEHEKKELEALLRRMTLENEEQRNYIAILKSELDSCRNVEMFPDRGGDIKKQVEKYRKESLKNESAMLDLQGKLTDLSRKAQMLEAENAELHDEVSVAREDMENITKLLEDAREQVTKLEEEKNCLESMLKQAEKEKTLLSSNPIKEQFNALQAEYNKVKTELSQAKEDLNGTFKQKQLQEDTIVRLRDDLKYREKLMLSHKAELDNEKLMAENKADVALAESSNYKEYVNTLKEDIERVKALNRRLEEEITAYKKDAEVKLKEVKQYRIEAEEYKKELDKTKSLDEHFNSTLKELEKTKQNNKEKENVVESLQEKLRMIKAENQAKTATIASLEAVVKDKQEEINDLTFQNKDLEKVLSENMDNIAKVQSSTISAETRLKKHISQSEELAEELSKTKKELNLIKEQHNGTLTELELLKKHNAEELHESYKRSKAIDCIATVVNKTLDEIKEFVEVWVKNSELLSRKFKNTMHYYRNTPEAKDARSVEDNCWKIRDCAQAFINEIKVNISSQTKYRNQQRPYQKEKNRIRQKMKRLKIWKQSAETSWQMWQD
eukprot:TRINITY_DN1615_c0_g1_i1.p1 TRINITY_DN1615_c0_g1~~TRINITY_DN1615_c0_g1_i1.p1  ORF type:complete len:572 (+),score=122.14 TRINITY_DN1615_c0_g1_i1:497-2212(+)